MSNKTVLGTMQLKAKRHAVSRDMVELYDSKGDLYAVSHMDLFWEPKVPASRAICDALEAGQTLTLNITVEEEPDA